MCFWVVLRGAALGAGGRVLCCTGAQRKGVAAPAGVPTRSSPTPSSRAPAELELLFLNLNPVGGTLSADWAIPKTLKYWLMEVGSSEREL